MHWGVLAVVVPAIIFLSALNMGYVSGVFLGIFAYIVPVFFLLVLSTMMEPLILIDNEGWYKAFKNSCGLVWGKWWRTFIVIFLPQLFNILINLIILFPRRFVIPVSFISSYGWFVVVSGVLIITNVLFRPLYYSCVLVQFSDLKARHQKQGI